MTTPSSPNDPLLAILDATPTITERDLRVEVCLDITGAEDFSDPFSGQTFRPNFLFLRYTKAADNGNPDEWECDAQLSGPRIKNDGTVGKKNEYSLFNIEDLRFAPDYVKHHIAKYMPEEDF